MHDFLRLRPVSFNQLNGETAPGHPSAPSGTGSPALPPAEAEGRRQRLHRAAIAGPLVDLSLFVLMVASGITWQTAQTLSFLIASAVVLGIWLQDRRRPSSPLFNRGFILPYLVTQLLGLFLRAGFLAMMVDLVGLPARMAVVGGVGIAWGVSLIGGRIWVFSEDGEGLLDSPSTRILAVVAYAAALRFLASGTLELLHEEAYYWNYAQHLDLGYLDHPPMVGWLIWLFTSLFGHTELGVRAGALLSWLVAAFYGYRLTLVVAGPTAALRALMLMAVLPIFFCTGLLMIPDAPLMACWAGALYYLYRAIIEEHARAWLGAGFFMGVGLLSKYTMVLLGGATLVFLVADRQARKWFFRPEPYAALALALTLFSPVIAWNAMNDWASFIFQGPQRITGRFKFALPELIGSILVLITPTGLLAAACAVGSKGSVVPEGSDSKMERIHRLLVILTVFPLSVFFVFSLFRSIKLNWTGPIWLGVLPYLALSTFPGLSGGRMGRWASQVPRLWWPTVVSLLLLWGFAAQYLTLGIPGLPYFPNTLGVGMEDFGRRLDSVAGRLAQEKGEKPFIVCLDEDRMAGWFAFYRVKSSVDRSEDNTREIVDNTTGGQLFGYHSNMYRFWHPDHLARDRWLLIIAKEHDSALEGHVPATTTSLSDTELVAYYKNGKIVGRYAYRVGRLR